MRIATASGWLERLVRSWATNLWLIPGHWTALELYPAHTAYAIPPACLATKLIHQLSKRNVLRVHRDGSFRHGWKWTGSVSDVGSKVLSLNFADLGTQRLRRGQEGHTIHVHLRETYVEGIARHRGDLGLEHDRRRAGASAEQKDSHSE